ncbi:MAG: hypothetical protein OEZ10_05935 [Gammaproteobacteria bacterium]|nr:hypothetical protein [Gammaproteobacteria bacterium]
MRQQWRHAKANPGQSHVARAVFARVTGSDKALAALTEVYAG